MPILGYHPGETEQWETSLSAGDKTCGGYGNRREWLLDNGACLSIDLPHEPLAKSVYVYHKRLLPFSDFAQQPWALTEACQIRNAVIQFLGGPPSASLQALLLFPGQNLEEDDADFDDREVVGDYSYMSQACEEAGRPLNPGFRMKDLIDVDEIHPTSYTLGIDYEDEE